MTPGVGRLGPEVGSAAGVDAGVDVGGGGGASEDEGALVESEAVTVMVL